MKKTCWIYQKNGQFKPIQAGVQIHFNGKNHWFTSIKLPDENIINILDSAGFTKLTTCSEIQLTRLYMKQLQKYEVRFCRIQPQFSGDCEVYAIVNTVEFCFNQFIGK